MQSEYMNDLIDRNTNADAFAVEHADSLQKSKPKVGLHQRNSLSPLDQCHTNRSLQCCRSQGRRLASRTRCPHQSVRAMLARVCGRCWPNVKAQRSISARVHSGLQAAAPAVGAKASGRHEDAFIESHRIPGSGDRRGLHPRVQLREFN